MSERPTSESETTHFQESAQNVPLGAGATLTHVGTPPALSQQPNSVQGFTLETEIGRGGMGVVYRARHLASNRIVALKMVLSGAYASRAEITRFLGEAETVATVNHPHVIQVIEFGESDGRPYFAMELLSGGSLAERLKQSGPMAPKVAAELIQKLATGISTAHELGIVHRDLKPENVLFDDNDVPKILDFGIAKRGAVDLTATGVILGTPAYMAPEQAAGRTKYAGPSVDVYSLGVILYECLTGRVPFQAPTVLALLEKIREQEPPRPREFAPLVPRDLEQIVMKCLAKNPLDRYPSAAMLAHDLQRYLAGKKPHASGRGSLAGMWSALDRGRHGVEFANYSKLFLWLALIMVMADCTVGLWINGYLPAIVGASSSLLRVVAVPLAVYWYAGRIAIDGSPGSRFLLALWSGHVLACVAGSLTDVLSLNGPSSKNYEQFALLTSVAFIALGPHYWGWCYAFGVGFALLPFLMRLHPSSSAFLFAGMWGISLISVSAYLRRLGVQVSADTVHSTENAGSNPRTPVP